MLNELKNKYNTSNIVIKLIMFNLGVHILLALAFIPYYLFTGQPYEQSTYSYFISEYLYFPSQLKLVFFRFWTIITYMFLHAGIFHILMNMLVLYWFGTILINLLPQEKIFPIYILGGISGALFFMIGFNIFPAFSGNGNLVGASASVMAIVLATATLNPKGRIQLFLLGSIELQYIALFWIIYNLLIIPGNNPGGALAHLGGAFMGWFYIVQLKKNRDLSLYINNFIDKFRRTKAKSKSDKFIYSDNTSLKQKESKKGKIRVLNINNKVFHGNTYSRNFIKKYQHMSKEECLNSILSKIKDTGYDGLTKDEKDFLDRYN